MGRTRRIESARSAFAAALASGGREQACLEAIEGLRAGDGRLFDACAKLIRAGNLARARRLLDESRGSNPAIIAILGGSIALAAGGFAVYSNLFAGGSDATITSRDEACAADLVAALDAFAREGGMPFETQDADADVIFDRGEIVKTYHRDGNRHEVGIAVTGDSGGCNLEAYRLRVHRPGSSESTRGRFGTVALTDCTCE